jgi:hypothetical protein
MASKESFRNSRNSKRYEKQNAASQSIAGQAPYGVKYI